VVVITKRDICIDETIEGAETTKALLGRLASKFHNSRVARLNCIVTGENVDWNGAVGEVHPRVI